MRTFVVYLGSGQVAVCADGWEKSEDTLWFFKGEDEIVAFFVVSNILGMCELKGGCE